MQQMPQVRGARAATPSLAGKAKVTLLDGSTGYVLLQNGLPQDDTFSQIWSAAAFVNEAYHKLVVHTHKQYLQVGASAITTNSFALQPTYYKKFYGEAFVEKMLEHAELSAKLAVQAREEYLDEHPAAEKEQILILGSLPPLVESHRPDLFGKALATQGEEFFKYNYKQLACALLKGGADVLLFETLNCWEEGRLALDAMLEMGAKDVPIYISFEGSLRDEKLVPRPQRSPELCKNVLRYKDKGLAISMIGWNCAPPEDIERTLEALESAGMLQILEEHRIGVAVYANLNERGVYDEGFEVEKTRLITNSTSSGYRSKKQDDGTGSWQDDPLAGYVNFTHRLIVRFGVSAVGGCCGCGPLGIDAIHRDLEAHFAEDQ